MEPIPTRIGHLRTLANTSLPSVPKQHKEYPSFPPGAQLAPIPAHGGALQPPYRGVLPSILSRGGGNTLAIARRAVWNLFPPLDGTSPNNCGHSPTPNTENTQGIPWLPRLGYHKKKNLSVLTHGTPVRQFTGTPVHWYTGTPIHWCTSTPVHKYTGTPVHQYTGIGTPVHWYTSTLVHRYIGTRLRG